MDETVASRIHPLRALFEALEPQRAAWRLLFDPSIPPAGPITEAAAGYRERLRELAAGGSQRFLAARGNDDGADAEALTAVWMGLVGSLVDWWLERPDESAEQMVQRCGRLLGAVLS